MGSGFAYCCYCYYGKSYGKSDSVKWLFFPYSHAKHGNYNGRKTSKWHSHAKRGNEKAWERESVGTRMRGNENAWERECVGTRMGTRRKKVNNHALFGLIFSRNKNLAVVHRCLGLFLRNIGNPFCALSSCCCFAMSNQGCFSS